MVWQVTLWSRTGILEEPGANRAFPFVYSPCGLGPHSLNSPDPRLTAINTTVQTHVVRRSEIRWAGIRRSPSVARNPTLCVNHPLIRNTAKPKLAANMSQGGWTPGPLL
jgi:hypothetical protein